MGVTETHAPGVAELADAGAEWRSGWVAPTWFQQPAVADARAASLAAHQHYRELVPSGVLPRRPSIAQLTARRQVLQADAAYETAKAAALRACAS